MLERYVLLVGINYMRDGKISNMTIVNFNFIGYYNKAEFKKEDKKNVAKGIAYLGGAGLVGQQAVRSGVPRLLGVRLESHSTSRKNAKEILKSGYLDPNKGGSGASKAINNADYISGSKNNVHITGKHSNHTKKIGGGEVKGIGGKKIRANATYKNLGNNLGRDILTRKFQKTMYRNLSDGGKGGLGGVAASLVGAKGKTLYTGGSDNHFNKNFTPDVDDLALKSTNKVRVHGSRAGATLEALKREGGGSRLKGIAKLVKANPSRALAGASILAGGGLVAAKLGQSAYKNLTGNQNKPSKLPNIGSLVKNKFKNK